MVEINFTIITAKADHTPENDSEIANKNAPRRIPHITTTSAKASTTERATARTIIGTRTVGMIKIKTTKPRNGALTVQTADTKPIANFYTLEPKWIAGIKMTAQNISIQVIREPPCLINQTGSSRA